MKRILLVMIVYKIPRWYLRHDYAYIGSGKCAYIGSGTQSIEIGLVSSFFMNSSRFFLSSIELMSMSSYGDRFLCYIVKVIGVI